MGQEKSGESSHFREITQTALPLLRGETFEVPNAQKPAFQFQGLLDLRVSAAPPSFGLGTEPDQRTLQVAEQKIFPTAGYLVLSSKFCRGTFPTGLQE